MLRDTSDLNPPSPVDDGWYWWIYGEAWILKDFMASNQACWIPLPFEEIQCHWGIPGIPMLWPKGKMTWWAGRPCWDLYVFSFGRKEKDTNKTRETNEPECKSREGNAIKSYQNQMSMWSVKCKLWNVECNVKSAECKVWSAECEV